MAMFSRLKDGFRKQKNKGLSIQDDNHQPKNGIVKEVESQARESHNINATPEPPATPHQPQYEVHQPKIAIADETGVPSQGVEARDHASLFVLPQEHSRDGTPQLSLAARSDGTETTNSSVHRAWSETSLSKALKRELPPQTGKGKVLPTFSINPKLTCSTFVSVNQRSLPVETMTIAWLEHGQYKIVKDRIYRQVKDFLIQEYGDDPKVNFSRTDGYMRLMRLVEHGPDVEVGREEMLSEAYWAHYLPLLVGKFCSENEQLEVRLEVHLTFVIVSIFDRPEATLAGKVWQVIEECMQKNWNDELFLARTWVNPIFTHEIVQKLVDDDPELPVRYPLLFHEKKRFVDYVVQFAQRLLAICVCARTPLTSLYQLYRARKQDQDLPLSQVPAGASDYEFASFFREQKRFHVFIFEASKDGGIVDCENVSEQATIPVINPTFLGRGSFGRVYRVSIHPRHHNFKQASLSGGPRSFLANLVNRMCSH
jgi:hypothetical protein